VTTCTICKKPMNTGLPEDIDCGGDCLECAGKTGDAIAARVFLRELRQRRTEIQQMHQALQEHTQLRQEMHDMRHVVLPGFDKQVKDMREDLQTAIWRLKDVMQQDDGQAYKEARKWVERVCEKYLLKGDT
jgi:t-SNARE complex subunit (syntaxin)